MRATDSLSLRALRGIGEIAAGTALDDVLLQALAQNGVVLRQYDVIALCQKIVSKAEGRMIDLATVSAGPKARELAAICGKDPRYVEVVLSQSTDVVRCVKGVLIVRHKLGFVVANAGIDQSNIEAGESHVLLLPENPDASAARLQDAIRLRAGVQVAVVITDSFGRAWRRGVIGVAIGSAGLCALRDRRGDLDRFGRPLRITEVAVADQVASAATLVMGEAGEGLPMVIVSGLDAVLFESTSGSGALVRPAAEDLFC